MTPRCLRAVPAVGVALAVALPVAPAAAQEVPLWVAMESGRVSYGTDRAMAITVNALTGNVVVTGSVSRGVDERGRAFNADFGTFTYSLTGRRLGGQGYDYRGPREPGPEDNDDIAFDLASDPRNGSVYVTGVSDGSAETVQDVATVAYDRSGRQLWEARYAGPGFDAPNAVAVDPNSGLIVVSASSFEATSDFRTLAYSPTGEQLWTATYDGAGGLEYPTGLAIDPVTGTIVVSGPSAGASGRSDFATVAYSPEGQQLWTARYAGRGAMEDFPVGVAIDSGRVYVAGSSRNAGSEGAIVTVAYSMTGRQLWTTSYAPADAYAYTADDIAVDSRTHTVLVLGTRGSGIGSNGDFVTLAYTPTGQQRWVTSYASGADGDDLPVALAVDPRRGTVYVAGSSDRPDFLGFEFTTIAYDVGAGDELRVDSYSRSPTGGYVRGLAVDPRTGNVYVTGDQSGGDTGTDYTTVAYPPAQP